ncbi:hypothetical protein B4143_0355 [Bacillus subtilis]|nr:hypothetical protein B4143_0355 [Bacillus subtilis]RPK07984.1 hypothetical protein EH5_04079 [Bacillus subtilis]
MQRIFSFLSISAFNSYELTAEIAQSTTLKKQSFQTKKQIAAIKTGSRQSALRRLT